MYSGGFQTLWRDFLCSKYILDFFRHFGETFYVLNVFWIFSDTLERFWNFSGRERRNSCQECEKETWGDRRFRKGENPVKLKGMNPRIDQTFTKSHVSFGIGNTVLPVVLFLFNSTTKHLFVGCEEFNLSGSLAYNHTGVNRV